MEGTTGYPNYCVIGCKKRLDLARKHAWQRWQKEYVHGLMEFHRITKGCDKVPQLGEVVLIIGEETNRGKWMNGRVLRYVKGKDGVIRGAIVLHKGNHIERPIHLLCPLEIRCRQLLKKNQVKN